MNKMILRRITLLVTLTSLALAAGCEIAVDFDRTKIPSDNIDGSTDAAGDDVFVPDTGTGGQVDAGDSGPSDAAHDADAK
jgi:hypothetical protein